MNQNFTETPLYTSASTGGFASAHDAGLSLPSSHAGSSALPASTTAPATANITATAAQTIEQLKESGSVIAGSVASKASEFVAPVPEDRMNESTAHVNNLSTGIAGGTSLAEHRYVLPAD
jgi:hypothetical protein